MGFVDLFRRRETRSSGNVTLAALGADWLGSKKLGPPEGLAVAQACVGAISQHLAVLPVHVYRFDSEARTEAPDHPFNRLTRREPNPWQTWPEFVEWLIASVLFQGNGLAEIVTGAGGQIMELRPIPWGLVRVELIAGGRVIYHVTGDDLTAPRGKARRLLAREVLHLRCRTDDGVIGVPPLRRAASAAEAAVAVQTYARSGWNNATAPSGIIKSEKALSPDAQDNLRGSIEKFRGEVNRGRTLILEDGLEFIALPTISPEDAELLESRKFTVAEIARIFNVPPPMIGALEHGTFTNSETLLRYFAQSTLAFWARRLETELSQSVFTDVERESYEIDVDLSGLLRGDPEKRWAAHKIAIEAKVLDPEEVREIEGFNPRQKSNPEVP